MTFLMTHSAEIISGQKCMYSLVNQRQNAQMHKRVAAVGFRFLMTSNVLKFPFALTYLF